MIERWLSRMKMSSVGLMPNEVVEISPNVLDYSGKLRPLTGDQINHAPCGLFFLLIVCVLAIGNMYQNR